MKTSFFTEASFLGLGVLEFDYLERPQKNSSPLTISIYKVSGLRTHSGASVVVAIPAVPSTGPCPQQGPALYLHSACMVWSGKAPRLPVGAAQAPILWTHMLRAQDKQPSPKSIPPALSFTETMTLAEKG